MPFLGKVQARGFSAYRYRVWNGSLGLQDIYSAIGGSIEKTARLPELAGLQAIYFWRVEAGNYQSNAFKTTNLTEQFRELRMALFACLGRFGKVKRLNCLRRCYLLFACSCCPWPNI